MKKLIPLLGLAAFMSCSTDKIKDEVKDKELKIMVMKAQDEDDGQAYKVRLFHEFKGEEAVKRKLLENMQYHTDSMFYKLNGTTKDYADAIIPIANGLKNSFEFLVVFNANEGKGEDLTYQDKYITGKTYQLSLK